MAWLPETADDSDEAAPASDPVVRLPRRMVVLAAPANVPRTAARQLALASLALGAVLGALGLVIAQWSHASTAAGAAVAARAFQQRTVAARALSSLAGAEPVIVRLPDAPDAGVGAPAPLVLPGSPPGLLATQERVGRGRTLVAALRHMGLERGLASRVVTALRSLVNMRSLQPSDLVAVLRAPEDGGALRRVELRRSEDAVWAVSIEDGGSLRAERVHVVRSSTQLGAAFIVAAPIERSLERARLSTDLLPRLQEALSALGLGRELRAGDLVRLVVTEERINDTPWHYGPIEALDYRGALGHRRGFYQAAGDAGDWYDARGYSYERGPLYAPIDTPRITSPYNPRRMHPVLHRLVPHLGTDFGAPTGTPVYAAAEGTLLALNTAGPTGNFVRLGHPTLGVETGYAHLSRFAAGLRVGQHVARRQLVGYVGTTGRSTGPHLHFSVKRGAVYVDPMSLYGGRRAVPASARASFEATAGRLGPALENLHALDEVVPNGTGRPPTSDNGASAPEPAPTPLEELPSAVGEGLPAE